MNATGESDHKEGTTSHVLFQKISTRYERDLFDKEVTRFYRRNLGGMSSENPAVMHNNHDWGRFQQWWEKQVEWNKGQPLEAQNAIFQNTATMLEEFMLCQKRRVNQEAALNQASSSGGTVANQARTLTASLRNATKHGVFQPIRTAESSSCKISRAGEDTGVPVGVPPVELVGASAGNWHIVAGIAARYKHIGAGIPCKCYKPAICKA